jgi:ubiquinone/menaquinone biosynthesis C-methylase UbiE
MPASDATTRFSSRVENYVRYRPDYPHEILDLLRARCGLTSSSQIADVGFGTGLFTQLLLKNGGSVVGVEPNREMREAGEKFLSEFAGFRAVHGTAEATSLPAHSFDFVTAAQAAHWFEREGARREFQRILKPGGWVVLLWNERITDSTPFLVAYEKLLLKYGTDYNEVRHERTTDVIQEFFAPAPYQEQTFPMRQTFDLPALEGRVFSSSYTPQPGDPNYEALRRDLGELFHRCQSDGLVAFEYWTRVFFGRLS